MPYPRLPRSSASNPQRLLLLAASALVLMTLAPRLHAQAGEQNSFFAGPGTHGASLNGAPLLPGTAVLAGEVVTTGPGGVAVLAPTHGAGGVLEMTSNASATVHAGSIATTGGSDELDVTKGNIMATGKVSLVTPQGQTFQSVNAATSYMVNVDPQKSSMGVLSGSVATFNTGQASAAVTVPAGNAVQVDTGLNGQAKLSNIKINQVAKPAVGAAVPQTVVASETRVGGG